MNRAAGTVKILVVRIKVREAYAEIETTVEQNNKERPRKTTDTDE